ncbi:MAG: sugar phosphate isomerase/epimerase [Bacteroidales bacterium]|nr:sugar phosphate isomerase/epimerase [Bacteroidales bacterium]
MEIKLLCPQWGHEHLDIEAFFEKLKKAGYDGVDTWLPENASERKSFLRLLDEYDLIMISHQHQANGDTIDKYCKSFEYYLNLCLESDPVLINSHSGRDYFTLEQQIKVLEVAEKFSEENNIRIAHEIHRGRIGYSPMNAGDLFKAIPGMKITADFSHWVCVTESYLENFENVVEQAVKRTEHIHARVGFPEGPQIPDPRSPFWKEPVDFFLKLWERIIQYQRSIGTETFTITPEFGPQPYMWTSLKDNSPVADQWEINLFMKDLLKENFSDLMA